MRPDRSPVREHGRLSKTAVHVVVSGKVQGLFYRAWTRERALAHGLDGWVRNQADGTVEAVFSGPEEAVQAMLAECREGPPAARVADVATEPAEPVLTQGFAVTD